jgi:hypothetical protein
MTPPVLTPGTIALRASIGRAPCAFERRVEKLGFALLMEAHLLEHGA